MKSSNKKYLGVVISTFGLFGLNACNSGTSNQTAATTTTPVVAQVAPTTPSCLMINLNSTTPNSKTKNNLLLTIQNNCSETLKLDTQTLSFLSQDVARTPVDAPLKFSATSADGKKYNLTFGQVNPQTGAVQSSSNSKFTLAPQEGIMLKGNGTLNGVAYDWKTANATLQLNDPVNPIADQCLKSHLTLLGVDTKKKANASIYVENTCDTPQSLKNKEISFLSQDLAGYPIALPKLSTTWSDGVNYSMTFSNNDGHYYVNTHLTPDAIVLPPHWGISVSGTIPLNGTKYDYFTAERTMLVRDTTPANLSACFSGHVFVNPDATTATEIQVAVQNNCDTAQAVKDNIFSFVAQDVNRNPIWVSTLVAQITMPQKLTYVMNFDALPDELNQILRIITPIGTAPDLVLQPHFTLTFKGTAPLMGQPFDLQTAEQSFKVTH